MIQREFNNHKASLRKLIEKKPRIGDCPQLPEMGKLFENQEQEWLNTEEAAKYLRVSVASLRNMTSNGQIPYYKLMGRNRYKLSDLRNLLCSSKKGGIHGN